MKQQTENGENPVLKKEASDGKPKDPCIHEAFLGVPKQIISKTLCSPVPESMCLKDWLCAFCCLRPGCLEYPKNEKQPLVSGNNNQYKTYTVIDDDERNLWSSPHDLSHTEAVDDRMLHSWIQTRNQLEKDSEEWQKLNYEIYTLRQARREVRARWRRILEDLGFQKEAESLLSVTKQSTISNPKNMKRAMELLVKLSDSTTIFPAGWDLPVRYLYIMDRLICLDAVDDFINIAQKKYPKTKEDISSNQ
ncbi:melanoregulin L homeolog isoform X2 [Xenopus laevis]|uniref:Melanoregulin L homeolog isoform X2 n=1 Tax=Xenopus laevis TaxID=8355 RepID=A0A8J1LRI7_XENLA|nr:melanoregulin L homeolog isoform X2 [Xenopus laevis]